MTSRRRLRPRRLSAPAAKQPPFRDREPVAKPSPAKVSVDCPHCGFKQMEYAAAKSTMCRQCGCAFRAFGSEGASAASAARSEADIESVARSVSIFRKTRGLLEQASQLDHRMF